MKTVTKKRVDWKAVAQKMSADKERINAYVNTPEQHKLNDITFSKPIPVSVDR